MKSKHIWFTIFGIVLLTAASIWWFFRQLPASSPNQIQPLTSSAPPASKPESNTNVTPQGKNDSRDQSNPYAGSPADELLKKKPPMFKTQTVPPRTPEEKAMWQWREAMGKADPGYAYKTPIEFYGKVVDQNGQLVAGATVDLEWTGIRGEALDKATKITGTDGRFVLTGVQGKLLVVRVHKADCISQVSAQGDYDFADFSAHNFYMPDSNNPIVFRVWKLGNPEPMYCWYPGGDFLTDGKPFWVDVKNGRVGITGDVAFSVIKNNPEQGRDSGYTLTIQAASGGGITMSGEGEFMFQAPVSGYQSIIRIEQIARRGRSDNDFKTTQNILLYVRTADGKYAAMKARVIQYDSPKANLDTLIFFNPSGSRNLEFDDKKQINR
jgi:hypothetical protein